MPDVVLPVLDERDALPWVLGRMPDGYAPIVVDNGSRDGSGALAAAAGRAGRGRAAARVRRRVLGRVGGGARRGGLLHGLRRVVRPARAAARRRPGRGRPRRPRARRALGGARRVAGARAGRQRARSRGSCAGAPAVPLRDLGPMRAARRDGAARARDRGPPVRLAAGDGAAARRRPGGGSTRSSSATRRAPGRSKVTGTLRGTVRAVRDMAGGARVSAALLVIAKEPVAGRVKTRLCPPCTPSQAARLARAALEDTLAACDRRRRRRAAGARARRPAGRVAPARLGGRRAARRRASPRGSRPRSRTPAGRRCWSGWTRRRSRPSCSRPGSRRSSGADAVFGPALDGGYWAIGLRRARRCGVRRRADEPRRTPARSSARGWRRSGCGRSTCRRCATWTTSPAARAVAAEAPGSRFAAELALVRPREAAA